MNAIHDAVCTSQCVVASGAVKTDVARAPEMATEWTRNNCSEHLLIHRVFLSNSIYYPINYIDSPIVIICFYRFI